MLFSVVLQLNKTDCPLKMKRFVEWYQGSAYEIPADIYSSGGSQTRVKSLICSSLGSSGDGQVGSTGLCHAPEGLGGMSCTEVQGESSRAVHSDLDVPGHEF